MGENQQQALESAEVLPSITQMMNPNSFANPSEQDTLGGFSNRSPQHVNQFFASQQAPQTKGKRPATNNPAKPADSDPSRNNSGTGVASTGTAASTSPDDKKPAKRKVTRVKKKDNEKSAKEKLQQNTYENYEQMANITGGVGNPDINKKIDDYFLEVAKLNPVMAKRQLEVEAYASMLTAFKIQGELTWKKECILHELRQILKISDERHRVELLRIDETFSTSPSQFFAHSASMKQQQKRATDSDDNLEDEFLGPNSKKSKATKNYTAIPETIPSITVSRPNQQPKKTTQQNTSNTTNQQQQTPSQLNQQTSNQKNSPQNQQNSNPSTLQTHHSNQQIPNQHVSQQHLNPLNQQFLGPPMGQQHLTHMSHMGQQGMSQQHLQNFSPTNLQNFHQGMPANMQHQNLQHQNLQSMQSHMPVQFSTLHPNFFPTNFEHNSNNFGNFQMNQNNNNDNNTLE